MLFLSQGLAQVTVVFPWLLVSLYATPVIWQPPAADRSISALSRVPLDYTTNSAVFQSNVNATARWRRADKPKTSTNKTEPVVGDQAPVLPVVGDAGDNPNNIGAAVASQGRPSISVGPNQPWAPMPTSPARTKSCAGSCNSLQADIMKCNDGGHVVISGSCTISSMSITGLNAIDIEIRGQITVSGESSILLHFSGSDVNIFGTGTINGIGPSYWNRGKVSIRPHLMGITIDGGSVSQLHLLDPPMFFLVVEKSKNVVISDLKLDARSSGGAEAYNSDGIDPSDSDNIVIQNCQVNNDDDCVAIKAGCTNILVQGLTCTHSHGVSIGSLSGSDHVEHVLVANCKFIGGQAAARIKTKPGGGGSGLVRDVTYENIQVSGGNNAIEINQCYENPGACKSSPSSVKIQDVHFKDFTGDATANLHVAGESSGGNNAVGLISCGSTGSCSDITMSGIRVSNSRGGSSGKLACSNAPILDLCT